MSTTLKQKLVCAAAAIAASVTVTAASAGPAYAEGLRSQTVSYADLDLSRDAGKATLAARAKAAAERVCGNPTHFRETAVTKRCVDRSVEQAMTQALSRS